MKRMVSKVLFLAIFGIAFVAGCEDENQTDTKMSRLVANENIQLKKDLQNCQKEIEKQKKLLEQCEQMNDSLQEEATKEMTDFLDSMVKEAMEENERLQEENKKLKAEIETLKAQ